jgi:DENN (AEX-3) domain
MDSLRLVSRSSNSAASINAVKWWIPKCICIISKWSFVYSFQEVLGQLYLMSSRDNYLPLERYICNFIDDVPSSPVGRFDIIYSLGRASISFRCPPLNQPHAWRGLPLTPLFECLSIPNIIKLFSAIQPANSLYRSNVVFHLPIEMVACLYSNSSTFFNGDFNCIISLPSWCPFILLFQ